MYTDHVALPAFAPPLLPDQHTIDISRLRAHSNKPATTATRWDGQTDGCPAVAWTLLSILCRQCQ